MYCPIYCSKKCVPPYEEVLEKEDTLNKPSDTKSSSPRGNNCVSDNSETNSDVVMDSLTETLDKALNIVKPSASKDGHDEIENQSEVESSSQEQIDENREAKFTQNYNCDENANSEESQDNKTNIHVAMLDGNSNKSNETQSINGEQTDIKQEEALDRNDSNCDSKKHVSFNTSENSSHGHVTNCDQVNVKDKSCDRTSQGAIENSNSEDQSNKDEMEPDRSGSEDLNNSALNAEQELASKNEKESVLSKEPLGTIDSFVNDEQTNTDSEMSEKELQDLHVRVDIFRFLLPGLCHLTSEDIPRMVLIKEGILGLLDLYMWRQWNLFTQNPQSREVQVRKKKNWTELKTRPRGYKTFFMLNSVEHGILNAH